MIRTVENQIRAEQERVAARARGVQHDLLGMAASRLSDVTTGNLLRLPSEVSNLNLQNAEGEMLFIDGYSDPDGPDIAP